MYTFSRLLVGMSQCVCKVWQLLDKRLMQKIPVLQPLLQLLPGNKVGFSHHGLLPRYFFFNIIGQSVNEHRNGKFVFNKLTDGSWWELHITSFEDCSSSFHVWVYLQEEAGSLLVDLSSALNTLTINQDDGGEVVHAATPIVEAASNILNVSSSVSSSGKSCRCNTLPQVCNNI